MQIRMAVFSLRSHLSQGKAARDEKCNHLETQICLHLVRQDLSYRPVEVRQDFHCELRIDAALHYEVVEGISERDPNAVQLIKRISLGILRLYSAFPVILLSSSKERDEEPAASVELIISIVVHSYRVLREKA